MTNDKWKVTYVYVNPGPAGPTRGKDVLNYKPAKGDIIPAMFGQARIKTVSKCRN
jgi:hypothetical protein